MAEIDRVKYAYIRGSIQNLQLNILRLHCARSAKKPSPISSRRLTEVDTKSLEHALTGGAPIF